MLTEEGPEGGWTDLVRGKGLWSWPHTFRRYYEVDPKTLNEPSQRGQAEAMARTRQQLMEKIRVAVEQGKTVACLQAGDPMMYGMTLFLEMLPADLPSEIVPGVGAVQAASAAVKMSPPYGYDTNAVILTMADWSGRADWGCPVSRDRQLRHCLQAAAAHGQTRPSSRMALPHPARFSIFISA